MDHPQTIKEKGYGSALALPVWVEIMQHVPERKYPAGPFESPVPLVSVKLCSISGARATSSCVAQGCAYDTQLPAPRVPRDLCQTHPEPPPMPVVAAPPLQPALQPGQPPTPQMPAADPALVRSLTMTPARIPPPLSSESQAAAPPASAPPTPVTTRVSPPLEPVAEFNAGIMRQERLPQGSRIIHWPAASDSRGVDRDQRAGRWAGSSAPSSVRLPRSRDAESPETVEVRRATPVGEPAAATTGTRGGPVTERRFVERLPDGRLRTTVIRSVHSPGTVASEVPPSRTRRHRGLFSGDD
jgi:penicillin-binding protein 1A